MKREFWDFCEKTNYTTVNIQGKNYKVINKFPDYYKAALVLHKISKIIELISMYLYINRYKYSKNDQIKLQCFCDIHPNNYLLSEMQLGTEFNGLNKPRDLYLTNKPPIGKDGKRRASYRNVFLTLRNTNNGKFNDWNTIMKLVIHEIAHTMCNHITWVDDNHGPDFTRAEKMIEHSYNEIIKCNK